MCGAALPKCEQSAAQSLDPVAHHLLRLLARQRVVRIINGRGHILQSDGEQNDVGLEDCKSRTRVDEFTIKLAPGGKKDIKSKARAPSLEHDRGPERLK